MPRDTEALGERIACYQDAQGEVWVLQRGQQRFLTFGNAVEQSCINLDQPYRLEHVYTQAMMLALILKPDAASACVLGLGGGSLVRALQQARPKLRIEAVEHRQAVIEAAQTHFELAEGPRLSLHCAEAEDYIASSESSLDLLMLDLYLAEGAHPAQNQGEFLRTCRQRLNPDGLLLINHWCSEYQQTQQAQAALREAFGGAILNLQVQGGNSIAFAFPGHLPKIQPKPLFAQAQQLGNQLAIPLQTLARNLWRQNAQALKIGRFAKG